MDLTVSVDAPVLTETIITPLAVRGNDVTLKCKGHGNPPVTFQWFKVVVSAYFSCVSSSTESLTSHHLSIGFARLNCMHSL